MFIYSFFLLLVQLLLGLPLEIVHGPLRIGVIYVAGGLSGSLLTSITDPEQFLAGASGGVYGAKYLVFSHLVPSKPEKKSPNILHLDLCYKSNIRPWTTTPITTFIRIFQVKSIYEVYKRTNVKFLPR